MHPSILHAGRRPALLAAMLGCAATTAAAGAIASDAQAPLPTAPKAGLPGRPSTAGIDGLGSALAGAALGRIRGRQGTVALDLDVRGNVDGNSAIDVSSGGNLIGDGAFGSATGIPTVIQNTGSNVLIQNGMNIHVQFAGSGP